MGRTSQLALAGLSAIAVAYGFARYGYGLFVPTFKEEFGLSTETVGLISSAGYAAYLSAMVLTGFLAGRKGPRFPVVTGALCAGFGMLLIATATSPMALIVGVVLAGSSPGFCWAPFSDAVVMLVEEKQRGRVLSAVSTGTTFKPSQESCNAGVEPSSAGSVISTPSPENRRKSWQMAVFQPSKMP